VAPLGLIIAALAPLAVSAGVEIVALPPNAVVDSFSDTGRWVGHVVGGLVFDPIPPGSHPWRVDAVLFNPGEGLLDLRTLAGLNGWPWPAWHAMPKRISPDGLTVYGTGASEEVWTLRLPAGPLWPIAADFDHDGDVDQSDFGLLQVQLGTWAQPVNIYDLNRDGRVDGRDVEAFDKARFRQQ